MLVLNEVHLNKKKKKNHTCGSQNYSIRNKSFYFRGCAIDFIRCTRYGNRTCNSIVQIDHHNTTSHSNIQEQFKWNHQGHYRSIIFYKVWIHVFATFQRQIEILQITPIWERNIKLTTYQKSTLLNCKKRIRKLGIKTAKIRDKHYTNENWRTTPNTRKWTINFKSKQINTYITRSAVESMENESRTDDERNRISLNNQK